MSLPYKCLISLFIFLGLYLLCKAALSWKEKHKQKSSIWQVDLKKVFLSPLKVLFLSWAIYYSLNCFHNHFAWSFAIDSIKPFAEILIISSGFWILYRWKKELFEKKWNKVPRSDALDKLSTISLFLLFSLMVLSIFNVDIVPLLTFGGIGAAALAFASKDVLQNFFSGGMISITRPFCKGDTVILSERNIEGVVEEIGWYFTCIRDKEKRPIYLPNSLFSTMPVINSSRMSHRRINEAFYLSYQDFLKVSDITTRLRDFLYNHPEIDSEAPLLVYWDQFKEGSLEIVIDAYCFATDLSKYVMIKQSVLRDVFELLEKSNVKISYPASVLEIIQK